MARAAGADAEKKSIHAAERARPDVAEARTHWHENLTGVDPDKLVFLDESGATTALCRTHARSPRGVRAVAKVPAGHWKVVSVVCAIRTAGPFAAASFVGTTDSAFFLTYVREILGPCLRPGEVVVTDNLSSHKVKGVREAVEAAGATLIYLPPYRPDLNPIEPMGSPVKRRPRALAAGTVDALHDAIGKAIAAVLPGQCVGFFRHCGYPARFKGAPL